MVRLIFKPRGLISPINVKIKLELPRNLINQWNLWKNSVLNLSSITVLRRINFKSTETQKEKLYTFLGASSKTCGPAAYINVINTKPKYCSLFS